MNIHEPSLSTLDWNLISNVPEHWEYYRQQERDSYRDYLDSFMKEREFNFVGEGRCRRTYIASNKKYVIKFPYVKLGITANREEHELWHRFKSQPDQKGIYLCPCRIINNLVLMMRAVRSSYGTTCGDTQAYRSSIMTEIRRGDSPNWIDYVECNQAGHLPDGRLVAYDYQSW